MPALAPTLPTSATGSYLDNPDSRKRALDHFAFWLAMGLVVGIMLGAALGNIGGGLLIGLAVGLERGSWYFWYDR